MQIVIDVSEDAYNYIKANGARIPYYKLTDVIKNGTPLPENHGRLIDADELKTAFPCGESVRTECVRATIDYATTIIEADKGSEDKE